MYSLLIMPLAQNLAEAEYVVAVYMYMRLLGYPAEKISILTTYNGQKFLIRDVINQRCAGNPALGLPCKVSRQPPPRPRPALQGEPTAGLSRPRPVLQDRRSARGLMDDLHG